MIATIGQAIGENFICKHRQLMFVSLLLSALALGALQSKLSMRRCSSSHTIEHATSIAADRLNHRHGVGLYTNIIGYGYEGSPDLLWPHIGSIHHSVWQLPDRISPPSAAQPCVPRS